MFKMFNKLVPPLDWRDRSWLKAFLFRTQPPHRWGTWGIIGLSSLLLVASCSSNKVAQCNSLIAAINQTESDLKSITQSSTPDITALQQIADTTQQAVTSLEALQLGNGNLKTFQGQFQRFYANVSSDAQAIVAAHEEQNMEAAEAAYQRLEATFEQQNPLVNSVNQYCSEGYEKQNVSN